MDIKFLFYAFLYVIAFIFVIRFGNKKSILIKFKFSKFITFSGYRSHCNIFN